MRSSVWPDLKLWGVNLHGNETRKNQELAEACRSLQKRMPSLPLSAGSAQCDTAGVGMFGGCNSRLILENTCLQKGLGPKIAAIVSQHVQNLPPLIST